MIKKNVSLYCKFKSQNTWYNPLDLTKYVQQVAVDFWFSAISIYLFK